MRRNHITRHFIVLTAVCLLFSAVAAAQTDVLVWVFPIGADGGRALYDNVVIPAFKEKHPDINLEIQIRPWTNRDEAMLLGFITDSGPDIAYLNLDFFTRFIEEGMLEPIDAYLTPEIESEYFPSVLEAVTFDGKRYGFPLLQQLVTYFYNVTMFETVGLDPNAPPANWEELESAARRLTHRTSEANQSRWGLYLQEPIDTTNMTYSPFLWQAGGEVFTPDGSRVAFDGPEGIEALTFLAVLKRNDLLTAQDLFNAGRIGMRLGTANDHGTMLSRLNLPFEWAPAPVLSHRERISYGTLASFAMFSNSKNKEAAAKVMQHLTSTEMMGAIMAEWGYIGPKRTIALDIYGEQGEWMQVFMDNINYTHYDITHPMIRDVYKILAPAVIRAINLHEPPSQALQNAARHSNALLDEWLRGR